ncbi:tripartite motif-containing protein 75-like [Pholidichthys leucotaenia]
MASDFYSEDLTCSVCLTLFTDPVTVVCGHVFCRQCITDVLKTQQQCPQCRAEINTEATSLQTSLILKSLAEKAKEAERKKKEVTEWLCAEHEEKLKLFCVTDQQFACIICRDWEKHEGHKFKPIKEAAASLRKELEAFMENVFGDICTIQSQANKQREKITKTKEMSQQLMTQIRSQFEVMHQFLRKREDEIQNELKHKEKDGIEKMNKNLKHLEMDLCESRKLEGMVTSVLKITDPEKFLKTWTEDQSMITAKRSFRPRGGHSQVINTSISLGPYESHLEFFVWKQMLQVIQPRPERLLLKSNSPASTVSDDGRRLFWTEVTEAGQGFSFAPGPQFAFGTTTQNVLRREQYKVTEAGQGFSFAPGPQFAFGTTTQNVLRREQYKVTEAGQGFSFAPGPQFAFGTTTQNVLRGEQYKVTEAGQGFSFVPDPQFTFGTTTQNVLRREQYKVQRNLFDSESESESDYLIDSESESDYLIDNTDFTVQPETSCTISVGEFSEGQHYWEIDVGSRDYWELGIKNYFIKYEGQKYTTCRQNVNTEVGFEGIPQKIGIYLNCSSKNLSFYDADNMTHIHSMSLVHVTMPVSAYLGVRYRNPDFNPLTVCWY